MGEKYKYHTKDQLISCDSKMVNKNSFLSWRHLLNIGLSIDKANEFFKTKYLQKIRILLSTISVNDKNSLYTLLISDNYTDIKAEEVSNYILTDNIDVLLAFIDEWYLNHRFKNIKLEYWLERGWDNISALKKQKYFFQAGSRTIKEKRKASSLYNDKFIKSRKPGEMAASKCFNNTNRSKKECEIIEILKKNIELDINTGFYSPVVHPKLKQIYKKYNFLHDILINKKIIVEYNDGYLHKDFITFPKFTEEQYFIEIIKAYNCLNCVSNRQTYKYVIIWENDLKSTNDIIQFINNIIIDNSNTQFFSTRNYDILKYNEYVLNQKIQNDNILKYKTILLNHKKNSSCTKKQVSALAIRNNKIIAYGNNKTIINTLSCKDYFYALYISKKPNMTFDEWKNTDFYIKEHRHWSNIYEQHAEMDILIKHNVVGSDFYISLKPCTQCIKALILAEVKNIYYIDEHSHTPEECIEYLNQCSIVITKI